MAQEHQHLRFPKEEEQVQLLPTWKMAIVQMLVTLMPIIGILYQGFVVLPEIRHTRTEFEVERMKESVHMEKMEALRKSAVTERSLLLMDLKEGRKLAKSLNTMLKEVE